MAMSSLDTNFLEVSAHALLKVATKSSFRSKKYRNLAFLGYFSEGKNGGMRPKKLKQLQQTWHYYTFLRSIFSGSRCTRFIESSHQSFFRGKKAVKFQIFRLLFLRQKRRSATKKIRVYLINSELSPFAQLHFIWKWVHLLH